MSALPDALEAVPAEPRGVDTKRRIVAAAMELFDRQGYDATTVDAIADGAGVSRRTFFHHFASKDAVLFLDHAALLERAGVSLAGEAAAERDPVAAVHDALRVVLGSYLADPELAVARYHLIRRSPELRAREIAWVQRYQLLFSRYLDARLADEPRGHLTADVLAASVVALHNNVLRHWLKSGGEGDADREFEDAFDWFTRSLGGARRGDSPRRLVVAVFDDDVDATALATAVENARRSSATDES